MIMQNWQKLEIEISNYLRNLLGNNYLVENTGGSDSFKPDIIVSNKSEKSKVFIEVKSNIAQCGQFVVLDENKTFLFSNENKTLQSNANNIITFMNKHYSTFSQSSTSGIELNLKKEIFYQWVKNYFIQKKVNFIATMIGSKVVFFKPENIDEYYDISATYRVKKSGSRDLPLNYSFEELRKEVSDYLSSNKIDSEIIKIQRESKKTRIFFSKTNNIKNLRIMVKGYSLFLNNITGDQFTLVKVLSNTANRNVIFSIYLKKNLDSNLTNKKFIISI
jgi:hypothetical protein